MNLKHVISVLFFLTFSPALHTSAEKGAASIAADEGCELGRQESQLSYALNTLIGKIINLRHQYPQGQRAAKYSEVVRNFINNNSADRYSSFWGRELQTVLNEAARSGDVELLTTVLQFPDNIDKKQIKNGTLLHNFLSMGPELNLTITSQVWDILVQHGMPADIIKNQKFIDIALARPLFGWIELLINKGSPIPPNALIALIGVLPKKIYIDENISFDQIKDIINFILTYVNINMEADVSFTMPDGENVLFLYQTVFGLVENIQELIRSHIETLTRETPLLRSMGLSDHFINSRQIKYQKIETVYVAIEKLLQSRQKDIEAQQVAIAQALTQQEQQEGVVQGSVHIPRELHNILFQYLGFMPVAAEPSQAAAAMAANQQASQSTK